MNKKVSIIFSLIVLSLVILLIYSQNKYNRSPVEYQINIETADINLKDVHLVKFNNAIYLGANYYIEQKGQYQKVDGLNIKGTIDNVLVLDVAAGGNPFEGQQNNPVRYLGEGGIFNKVKISDDTLFKVHIVYTVDHVKKEYFENLKLSDYRKKLVN
ncbi:hypothetical protein [Paenibacillus lentus]|nr:hypothetical protein [Paenibacillus lentus]